MTHSTPSRASALSSHPAVDARALPIALALTLAAAALLPPTAAAGDAELLVARRATLPSAPADAVWDNLAPSRVALIPQDMVEPRQLQATTGAVVVRAVSDGSRVAFRLEWSDQSVDDMAKPAQFTDACAVQVPRDATADVPAPQMGEPGRPVEITYWRASWQAAVDGRSDSIQALYPGAAVDHYPFEAAPLEKNPTAQQAMALRYAPARAAGNEVAGPRQRAVEDLIAEGPGSLSPATAQDSTGGGVRTATGWAVVLVRRLPAALGAGKRSQVAFAVWDGAHDEVGARKMRSGWVPIAMAEEQ
jgi:DMSO reductase family type II enzyme heme b subunit